MSKSVKAEVVQVENAQVAEIVDDSGKMTLFGGSSQATFSSIVPKTQDEKVAFYNAINAPTAKLGDFINMEIEVANVYAEECEYVNKETGEIVPGVRIILFGPDMKAYSTSSKGVFNCLSKIFTIFGHPSSWEAPIKVRVKQVSPSADRKVLLLEMV